MRYIFFSFLLLVSILPLSGQKKIERVPDLVPVKDSYLFSGRLDSSQYKYFLNGILKEQFETRRDTLKRIMESRKSLLSHLDKIKNEYLKLLGPMPEKTPLNPVITGKIEKGNYSIEKVAYESRPYHHVTALLYLPKGRAIPVHFTHSGVSIYSKRQGLLPENRKIFCTEWFCCAPDRSCLPG